MMLNVALTGLFTLQTAFAFPWMGENFGLDGSLPGAKDQLEKRQGTTMAGCPVNPNHVPAVPISAKFPYLGAVNGAPATKLGNIEVPADGDTAHNFVAPGKNDIRGPCPGLNTAANHNFISHDGVTNLNEMLDAQQNIWNVGYDLAMVLAVIGISLTGDPITTKMSIGCDATSRTATSPLSPPGEELGIDAHNKFEADTSLSRSDFYLKQPDDFTLNTTLFGMMYTTVGGTFGLPQMVKYMGQRYQQSLAQNPNFYFGPKVVLLYGAASFLFRLFPNFTGDTGPPTLHFIAGFFGVQQSGTGSKFGKLAGEQILDDWNNRLHPWTVSNVASDFATMYSSAPVLLGGNANKTNDFDGLGANGTGVVGFNTKTNQLSGSPNDFICLLYQIATEDVPSSLESKLGSLSLSVMKFATVNLNPLPVFTKAGCTLKVVS